MGMVIFDISMSLDGFMTGAGQTAEEPMGKGGERLTEWAFGSDERDREVLSTGVAGLGSVICGRRTYDTSLPWWGPDGPTGSARVPVFVLSHGEPDEVPEGGVYSFADGIESALDAAREVAGDRYVTVMGGAETGQQYLRAGLVDELSIHLVPILLGGGTRMFENLGDRQIVMDNSGAIHTPAATHLRFRLKAGAAGG